jgi:hypothetical protein
VLAFDCMALAWALRRAAGDAEGLHWKADVEGFELLAAYSAGLPASGRPASGATLNITETAARLTELAARHKLADQEYAHDGVGILTATSQQIRFTAPTELVRVRRVAPGGGYHLFAVVPAKEAWVYDFCYPLSPDARIPDWLPARYRREAVTCVPVEDGMLWLTPAQGASRFELFAKARRVVAKTSGVKPSSRWGSVLWPLVTVAASYRLAGLAGASLGDNGPKLLDAFQMLKLGYATDSLSRALPPTSNLDEPLPLAYNASTLVFKTGRNSAEIQWLYHFGAADWDVFGDL